MISSFQTTPDETRSCSPLTPQVKKLRVNLARQIDRFELRLNFVDRPSRPVSRRGRTTSPFRRLLFFSMLEYLLFSRESGIFLDVVLCYGSALAQDLTILAVEFFSIRQVWVLHRSRFLKQTN